MTHKSELQGKTAIIQSLSIWEYLWRFAKWNNRQ